MNNVEQIMKLNTYLSVFGQTMSYMLINNPERFKHNMNRLKEKINNPNLTPEQKAVCEMEYQAYDIIQYRSTLVQGNYSESSRDILLFAKENYISVKEFETKGISL